MSADNTKKVRDLADSTCFVLKAMGVSNEMPPSELVAVALLSAVHLITRNVPRSGQAVIMDGACVMLRQICDMELANPASSKADPEQTGMLH